MKIKKNDIVRIMVGKDRGREGKVIRVYPNAKKVLIENLNMFKKAIKKSEQSPQGGIVDIPRPIQISNVMLMCPKVKKPTKVGYKIVDGAKKRYSKVAKKIID